MRIQARPYANVEWQEILRTDLTYFSPSQREILLNGGIVSLAVMDYRISPDDLVANIPQKRWDLLQASRGQKGSVSVTLHWGDECGQSVWEWIFIIGLVVMLIFCLLAILYLIGCPGVVKLMDNFIAYMQTNGW